MNLLGRRLGSKGFALPTVLIASIVLLSVLAVSVTATTAVRTTLKNQYYAQLAQVAGEAGVAYAKLCLAANGNVAQWSDAKPLTPATDCNGNALVGAAVKVLVVAGGGGGSSGGGGGGGVVSSLSQAIGVQSYTITVGAGGLGCIGGSTGCTNGGNSSFSTAITAIGGGYGAKVDVASGASGGSGGGGGASSTVQNFGGSGVPGQGYAGGSVTTAFLVTPFPAAGGGGAGGVGANPTNVNISGNGGPGIANDISGATLYYGGGGGGGWTNTPGSGGSGGGGNAGNGSVVGTAGAANTGGGGGGGGNAGANGAGGTGIVVVSYPTNSGIVATGGTITTSGLYKIHSFTASGTFAVTSAPSAGCPTDPRCSVTVNGNIRSSFKVGAPQTRSSSGTAQALIVAGGGGAASGGGGAGGVQTSSSIALSAQTYPVVVGAGGNGCTPNSASTCTKGGDSSFASITAGGGGYGGHTDAVGAPSTGGSGGGGGSSSTVDTTGAAGTAGQGFSGGSVVAPYKSSPFPAAGGGGAGGAGANPSSTTVSGNGGIGIANSITGTSVYYGGGGGGAVNNAGYTPGNGGLGGGGIGASAAVTGTAGTANTGGGGGGAVNGQTGGAGGSGVVIISYKTGTISASGGTITTAGGNTIHTFTSSGNFVVSGGGQALTIPNTGYVEITRSSNGSVWRTYTQPSVQAAVVQDVCTNATSSSQGWNNAVLSSSQDALPLTASAQTITLQNGPLNAGPIYFRKDFNVTDAGNYQLQALIPSDQLDTAEVFVDGAYKFKAASSLAVATMALTTGCHNVTVRLTNATLVPKATRFTAAIQSVDGAAGPVAATNTNWRVTAGNTVHYSSSNYYDNKTTWQPARVLGVWNNGGLPWGGAPAAWTTTSGDTAANYITTINSASSTATNASYPGNSYSWFRSTQSFTLASATQVRISNYCDDRCETYLDGNLVYGPPAASGLTSQLITVQPGTHSFGIRLYNLPSANVGAFLFAAVNVSSGAVLMRSDAGWETSNFWSTTPSEYYSYDTTFFPSPSSSISTANVQALAVGGGGSGGGGFQGGGGGGGGFVYSAAKKVITGLPYPVVVGAGGAAGGTYSFIGGNSSFDSLIAFGGGGGAGEPAGTSYSPTVGGSGGGGSHPTQVTIASGIIGQGNLGGVGYSASCPCVGAGGGGAGAVGANATPSIGGAGGAGVANPIVGSTVGQLSGGIYYLAGGGGGSMRASTSGAGGLGGGGAGNGNGAGQNGTANTGGGGGSGGSGSATGPAGGGGAGVVIISYPTGLLTATGGTITTSGGNTIHTFIASGTFTVTSVP